jgi:murein DD-endopeptidase MepM/ murein hydrolase activator NlpD
VFIPGAQVDPVELRRMLGQEFFWPTKGGRISSYFGRRDDPFTGVPTNHSGVDIAINYGAPVLSAGDGVVSATGFNAILGNYIRIDQGQGYAAVYGHLSAILTKPGRRVLAGQTIGKVGSTGYSTGPHLHFSAYRWNRLLNPMTLFG